MATCFIDPSLLLLLLQVVWNLDDRKVREQREGGGRGGEGGGLGRGGRREWRGGLEKGRKGGGGLGEGRDNLFRVQGVFMARCSPHRHPSLRLPACPRLPPPPPPPR